jgi:hypothetical protein
MKMEGNNGTKNKPEASKACRSAARLVEPEFGTIVGKMLRGNRKSENN